MGVVLWHPNVNACFLFNPNVDACVSSGIRKLTLIFLNTVLHLVYRKLYDHSVVSINTRLLIIRTTAKFSQMIDCELHLRLLGSVRHVYCELYRYVYSQVVDALWILLPTFQFAQVIVALQIISPTFQFTQEIVALWIMPAAFLYKHVVNVHWTIYNQHSTLCSYAIYISFHITLQYNKMAG